MSTICFYAQFVASKVGVNSLTVTWDVEQITRSDGTRSALVTGGATTITVGRRGLYGYRLASADLSLYDYVATAITADETVDQKEVAAIGMVIPDALVSGALQPTTPGRTLDVSAGGEAGIDWANVGGQNTAVVLSNTSILTAESIADDLSDQQADLTDIQSRIPAALVSGRMDSSIGAVAANAITAAALAADAGAEIATAVRSELAVELAHIDADISSISAGSSLTAQQTRDAMKLAPTAGAPAAGSVDAHLDAIQAQTDTIDDIKAVTDALDISAVTQVAASAAGHLTITVGLTFDEGVTGLTIPADWVTALWTLKNNARDADTAALVQLRATNPAAGSDGLQRLNGAALVAPITAADGELTVTQATGRIDVWLSDEMTALLGAATAIGWDVKFIDASGDSSGQRGTADVVLTETKATA